MKEIKGVVTWVGDKKKYGNYSFKLAGYDEWFRSPGRAEGVLEAGNTVKVKVEENARGDFEVKAKPVLVEKGEPRSKGGGKGGSRSGGSAERFKEDPEKASRITVQASQKLAADVVKLLIEQGGIKIPKTKPDDARTVILETIDELTAKFYAQVYDPDSFLGKQKEIDDDFEDGDEESEEEPDEDGFEDDVPWDKE